MSEDWAKAFAAIVGGITAIGAAGAASYGFTLAAIIAGVEFFIWVAGIGLAVGLEAARDLGEVRQ